MIDGWGKGEPKNSRQHRRPWLGFPDGYDHDKCRPREVRRRSGIRRHMAWYRYWQRWSRKRRAARKRRRGWS